MGAEASTACGRTAAIGSSSAATVSIANPKGPCIV